MRKVFNKKNNQLSREVVRMERNVDTLPIWSPSQYGRLDEREYKLQWIHENAKVTVQKAGRFGLLRWQDKLILAVLVHFWNQQGQDPEGWVNFTIADVAKTIREKVGGTQHEQIKNSLWRLRGCLVQYFQSFFDKQKGTYISKTQGENILTYLTIYEYKSQNSGTIEATQARLNLDVVRNLLGNYTRPISLNLWLQLSERGGLFEAYINSVLYKNQRVSKDVFDLWDQLGLSTKGAKYGSKLADKMKPELEKICNDTRSLLDSYEFEKSKSKPRSLNLVMYRREKAFVDAHKLPRDDQLFIQFENTSQFTPTDFDQYVEKIRFELGDTSSDDSNIRRIAQLIPKEKITVAITDAVGREKDGMLKTSAVRYFIGRMKREAQEQGIDLGFAETPSEEKPTQQKDKAVKQKTLKTIQPPQERRRQQNQQPEHISRQLKIDTYYVTLPEDKRNHIHEIAIEKAKEEMSPNTLGFDQLVKANIRLYIAKEIGMD